MNTSPEFLWAAYWRLQDKWGTKADCYSPLSLPMLNCVMRPVLGNQIFAKTPRSHLATKSLDEAGCLCYKNPTWGCFQLLRGQLSRQSSLPLAGEPGPLHRQAWIGVCMSLIWAWELNERTPVPLCRGQLWSRSEALFSSQETASTSRRSLPN